MTLSLQQFSSQLFSTKRKNSSLANAQLHGHDMANKHDALEAVDILVKYKTTVHEFTDEIIEFWPLPRRIMERYQFDDAEQLNEWLDKLS
ncbi:hypothetical protein AU255_05740 [Methyloprofundus sedimenti]|uniref:Uncharacterized protein n=1 Tax=Methyloprofundus sedimenti TaxID=1420851 RepID=A0A1V8M728_9GAMM|nr:hypothetical protein [Methyloprofundus sedimenti]OQK17381.1 hypothetical protein AU255_05740 [Methyloprofundus sedimenti]